MPGPVLADTPAGWLSLDNPSAYTTTQGELQLSLDVLAVNDDLDVLDVRDDIVASNSRLSGNTGDLSGRRIGVSYGLSRELEIYASHQSQALSVDLGEISSLNVIDIDNSLDTRSQAAGLKWTLYRGLLLNPNNYHSALTLQLEGFRNTSDSFDVVVDQATVNNFTLFFDPAQTFSVNHLEDEGWRLRLHYSRPLFSAGVITLWGGYSEADATAGTGSTLGEGAFLANTFEQAFEREESYYHLGASLNFRISPRLPVTLSYEYLQRQDLDFRRDPAEPSDLLPGFLSASGAGGSEENHRLNARVSWWVSPRINIGLSGTFYSNQYTGLIPHFNNPLSESLSDLVYGHVGIELGLRF